MKDFNKILVLENDIEHQGLPDQIDNVIHSIGKPHDVWWWFGEDVRQNTERSLKRFAEITPDTLVMTQPSFVGYGNTFEGKLALFAKLAEMNVRLMLGIVYYPDFYLYVLYWLHRLDKKERERYIPMLKLALESHEIYCVDWMEIYVHNAKFSDCIKQLTWEDISKNYYDKKIDRVRIKSTGEVFKIGYVSIDKEKLEDSRISIDRETGRCDSSTDDFKFKDIEKVC